MRWNMIYVALWCVVVPCAAKAQGVIVAYDDCGWRYAHREAPFDPVVFSTVTYDDASWEQGRAPLKRSAECAVGGAVMPVSGHIIMQRHIFNTTSTPIAVQVNMRYSFTGGCAVNGLPENTGGAPNGACDGTGPRGAISSSFMAVPGDNVVMIRSFFGPGLGDVLDALITATNPTAIRRGK